MSVRLRGVSSVYVSEPLRLVAVGASLTGGAGHRLGARDRGDTVGNRSRDVEVGVVVRRGVERHAGQQRVHVGQRAARRPDPRTGVVGRRHRTRSGGRKRTCSRVGKRQGGGDVRAVRVGDHDVGQVERRVFRVGLRRAQVGRAGRRVGRERDVLRPGDRRRDTVGNRGVDAEGAGESTRRRERDPGEQGVDVGDRAAGGPDPGPGVEGGGDRPRSRSQSEPAAVFDKVSVAVTLALSTSLTTMSVRFAVVLSW